MMTDQNAPVMKAHELAAGGNKLLEIMRPHDLEYLATCGSRRSYGRGDIVYRADQQADAAYFVEQGIVSVVKVHDDGRRTEICLIGPEGFTGTMRSAAAP